MIDACAKGGDPERAELWHTRMLLKGVQPNAHSFSAVINACAKAGNVDSAVHWLNQMESNGVAVDVGFEAGAWCWVPCARTGFGLLPRLEIRHTSESHAGQIYLPQINALLGQIGRAHV